MCLDLCGYHDNNNVCQSKRLGVSDLERVNHEHLVNTLVNVYVDLVVFMRFAGTS